MIIHHIKVAAQVIFGYAGGCIVRGINVYAAVKYMGRRIGRVDVRYQRLRQEGFCRFLLCLWLGFFFFVGSSVVAAAYKSSCHNGDVNKLIGSFFHMSVVKKMRSFFSYSKKGVPGIAYFFMPSSFIS